MNIKNLALFSAALLLAGCPGGEDTDPTDNTDSPTPIPAFEWHVTLDDGDGAADAAGVVDADTTVTSTENSAANFADIVDYEFGLAQTGIGSTNGWFGEDCDGVVTNTQDICHPMLPDTTMTLTRVGTIGEIVAGTSTLNIVDFPVDDTPSQTYVLYGYDTADMVVECWTQGGNPAYFGNCDEYVPAM